MDEAKKDKAIVLEVNGDSALIARTRGDQVVEVGVVTPRADGMPIDTSKEVVNLSSDGEGAYDLETVYQPPATSSGRVSSRPATKQYTQNWDRIFGGKGASQSLN